MSRSEAQKVAQAPIKVVLGGKEFGISLLCIKDAQEWRAEVSKAVCQLPDYANASTDDPEAFKQAMNGMLVGMPNTVADLFFSYAKSIDKDWILANATEPELAEAFGLVIDVGFPLSMSLAETMGRISR